MPDRLRRLPSRRATSAWQGRRRARIGPGWTPSPSPDRVCPRTAPFGGKTAPGYFMAKLIIKLIHAVAAVLNRNPQTRDLLTVA